MTYTDYVMERTHIKHLTFSTMDCTLPNFYRAYWYLGGTIAPHKHEDFYELFFTTISGLTHLYNNKETILDKGTLFILPPKSQHQLIEPLDNKRQISHFNLILSSAYIDNFFTRYNQSFNRDMIENGLSFVLTQSEYQYLKYLAKKITYRNNNNIPPKEIIDLLFFNALSFSNIHKELPSTTNHSIEYKLKEQFDNFELLDQSIENICNVFKINQKRLIIDFKNLTGVSIVAYRANKRIEFSKNLLKFTNYSILDIAIKVGYYSSSHFIKNFKDTVGVTPLQYRLSNNTINN